jgi:dTDP-4-amino-4,6-dideoxygalactose transaminase
MINKYGQEEIANLTKVIESGNFADHAGGFMDQLRHDFAKATGAKHAITAATAMLLMHAIPGAINAGGGDEIICDPVVQFHGIACLHNNVVPVWADVRPDNFLMDPDSVEALITPRTRAIWVTHLWGFAAEVDKLREIADRHGIYLLEDCAHGCLGEYKGKKLGTWGQVGTFSFNMGKQLATGEGGIAITNDDKMAFEINRRIIFGESPEVLSSNYRMTEFQAAVAVPQLKKVPVYLEEYRKSKEILDAAIAGCEWLDARKEIEGTWVAPYFWSCLFHGERKNVPYNVFKAALRQVGAHYGTGFLQVPAYMYDLFRNPNAYGKKGWAYDRPIYPGKGQAEEGLCPVSEDIIPRIVYTNNMVPVEKATREANLLQEAIKLAESGNVAPLVYSDLDKKVLEIVKQFGPLEPSEAIRRFDENGWEHLDEHTMFTVMEDLRERTPYKLSHAGPRKFAYHDLSR